MTGPVRRALHTLHRRLRRIERREVREFRNWIEHAGNLIQVLILLFLPLLIGLVTDGGSEDPGPALGEVDGWDEAADPSLDDQEAVTREATEIAVATATTELESRAARIESDFDVPCEVIVAVGGGDPATTVLEAAAVANCDLITAPYESSDARLTGFVRGLFAGDVDVLVHYSPDGRTTWRNALVPVRSPGDVAHAMLDFALRLVDGEVSVCHCIGSERERRSAETMLSNLVETFDGNLETRVARTEIESFLERNDDRYDVVFLGASTDRSAASRLLSKPTFQRVGDVDTDVAVVHRG